MPPGTDPETVLAVHPTQLYEIIIMLAVFAVFWRWRLKDKPVGWLFGVYLLFAGIERFLIEILRAKDDRFLGPLTVAQVVSMVLIVIAATLIAKYNHSPSPDPGPYLSRPGHATEVAARQGVASRRHAILSRPCDARSRGLVHSRSGSREPDQRISAI